VTEGRGSTAEAEDIFEQPQTPDAAPVVVRATDLTGVHVLKHDNLFMLSNAYGDVHVDGRGLGLYDGDTRMLSTYDLRPQRHSPRCPASRISRQLSRHDSADQSRLPQLPGGATSPRQRSSCADIR
jgi:hypothetical protein